MDFELFTYGGGELLRLTFNAIAAFMASGNNDYLTLLKISAMVGLLVVLVQSAFKGGMVNFQWLLAIIMIYYVAMVPRANVIITDRVNPAQSGVVSNVPIGLAFTAGFLSHTGDWLTQGFEALFSLPGDMEYSTNGLLFGSRLVESARHFEITDPRISENLTEFWQQCVFYDVLLGRYGMQDLFAQPDIWAFIQTNTSKVRAFPYKDATNTRSILICKDAAEDAGPLGTDVANAIAQAERYYGDQLVRATNRNAAIAKFSAALPTSFQYLTGLSMSSSQIVRQAALSNSMKRGVSSWAAKVDAPAAAQDYAMARAESERRTSYAVMGELASRMMPIIRNIFEAFIYAVFPIVFVMFMLPIGAKAALGYVKALIWINLWAPIYAILHLAITLYSADAAKASVRLPDGSAVYSMANYTGLAQVMNDHALLAGYLTLSIPMIAWMLVNSGGAMMASLAGKVMESYEKPVSQGATESTTGNIQLGNTGFGNSSWWQSNTAPSDRYGSGTMQGADGRTYTHTNAGDYVQIPQSQLSQSVNLQDGLQSTTSRMASQEVAKASQQVSQYSEQFGSTYSDTKQFVDQLSSGEGFAKQFGSSEAASLKDNFSRVQGQVEKFAKENGLSVEEATAVMGAASASAKAGVAAPGPFTAGVGVSLDAKLQGSGSAKFADAYKNAQELMSKTDFGRSWDATQSALNSVTASYTGQNAQSDIHGVMSASQRMESVSKTTSESLQRAERFVEAEQLVSSGGFTFTSNASDLFRQYSADKYLGGDSHAFDDLQQRAARGDMNAQRQIDSFKAGFTEDVAERLAGVDSGPSSGGIQERGSEAVDRLFTQGQSRVAAADQAADRQVGGAASGMAIDRGDVRAEAAGARSAAEGTQTELRGDIDRQQINAGTVQDGASAGIDAHMDRARNDKDYLMNTAWETAGRSGLGEDIKNAVDLVTEGPGELIDNLRDRGEKQRRADGD